GFAKVTKDVAAPSGTTPASCQTATWGGAASSFGPGDVVCWRLTVTFPDGVYGGDPKITDFLPEDVTYTDAGGDYWLGADNDVAIGSFDKSGASDGVLVWKPADTGEDT